MFDADLLKPRGVLCALGSWSSMIILSFSSFFMKWPISEQVSLTFALFELISARSPLTHFSSYEAFFLKVPELFIWELSQSYKEFDMKTL